MPDSYALALQAALGAALRADATVAGFVGARVYDEPPQGVQHPMIRVGAIEPRPLRSDGKAAAEVEFGIEVYSRPAAGRVECTQICEAVVAALDEQPLTVTGFQAVYVYWITQTVERESNGQDYTGVMAFRTLLDG